MSTNTQTAKTTRTFTTRQLSYFENLTNGLKTAVQELVQNKSAKVLNRSVVVVPNDFIEQILRDCTRPSKLRPVYDYFAKSQNEMRTPQALMRNGEWENVRHAVVWTPKGFEKHRRDVAKIDQSEVMLLTEYAAASKDIQRQVMTKVNTPQSRSEFTPIFIGILVCKGGVREDGERNAWGRPRVVVVGEFKDGAGNTVKNAILTGTHTWLDRFGQDLGEILQIEDIPSFDESAEMEGISSRFETSEPSADLEELNW